MPTISHKKRKTRKKAVLRSVYTLFGVAALTLSILWYAPSFGYAQVTPNQPVDCGTTNFSNLEAGQGFIFEGVSPGCYSAGFCGQCDVLLVIKNVVEAGFGLIGAFATLMLVIAGFLYLISRGNDRTVQQAKGIIASTITGLVISFLAWTIVGTVAVLVSGDPNATIASIQCSDVPAVSTCTLVSNVGDLPQGVFGGSGFQGGGVGAGGSYAVRGSGNVTGSIQPCGIDEIPIFPSDQTKRICARGHGSEACHTMAELKGWVNTAAKRSGIDPVYLMAIANIESGLGANIGPSVTGAYGIFQFQPSTAAGVYEKSAARTGAPSSCLNEHSRRNEAGYVYNPAAADGYCRNKYVGSRQHLDSTCGRSNDSKRTVFEQFATSCKDWIVRNPEHVTDAAAVFIRDIMDRKTNGNYFEAACVYNGGGTKCPSSGGPRDYAGKAERAHRQLCAEYKGQSGSPADSALVAASSLNEVSIVPAALPLRSPINLANAHFWGGSLTKGYGSVLEAAGQGTEHGIVGQQSYKVSPRVQEHLQSSAAGTDLMVITYGTNDLFTLPNKERAVLNTAKNLKKDVEAAHAQGIPVFAGTFPDWGKWYEAREAAKRGGAAANYRQTAQQISAATASYNAWVRLQAEQGNIEGVVDFQAALPTPQGANDPHPSRAQYATMADVVRTEVTRYNSR